MRTSITLMRYQPHMKQTWDAFVAQSRNGTFLLQRDFMDYHADRFTDHSLLFYADRRLLAVLPAEEAGEVLSTHRGLTYGGFITSASVTASQMLAMMRCLLDYLREQTSLRRLVYSPVPTFYASYPCEEDRYALFRHGAQRTQCKLTSIIPLANPLPFSTLRRRKIKVFEQASLMIKENEDWSAFWAVLTQNLQERHQVKPVHCLDEILRLHAAFPDHIRLHQVFSAEGEPLGGAVVFETDRVAHVQYIASTESGRALGVLDGLFAQLITQRYAHKTYFDFGVSVEQGGWVLNEGLIHQKEGFGARAAIYETYEVRV
ncbi:MAG: GNAT family N-acetyltransferase, partial [Bacteroidaceae bacterium]|nr:GNAT family N-acetyltransferase [Bacteroidaceae bacterium]